MARVSRKGGATKSMATPLVISWSTAIYGRLSVEDSGRKGADTIETQIELIHSYIGAHADLEIYSTYVDNGETGADFDRPAWNRMMDDIRSGKVNCIVVKDLSRFGRNYIEACELLEKIFPFMGVRFISINDGYDSERDGGRSEALLIALKNLVNDRYVKEVSRKVSASKKAMRERGEYCGAFAPFGYKKSKLHKNKLEPNEETAPIVREIFRWRAGGMGQAAICKRLDEMGVPCPSAYHKNDRNPQSGGYYKAIVWQPKAIKRMIASRLYLGHLEQGKSRQSLYARQLLVMVPEDQWYITENAHEAIVELPLWEAANAVSKERRAKYHDDLLFPNLPDNILRGFLVCGMCGSKLVRRHNKKTNPSGKQYEYFYYTCPLSHQHSDGKPFPMIRYETIYNAVYADICLRLLLVTDMGSIIEKQAKSRKKPRTAIDAEITRTARELEETTERLSKLYEDYVDKMLTEREYVKYKAEKESKAAELRERIDDLSARAALMSEAFDSDNRWLKVAKSFLDPKELTREMLEATATGIKISSPDNIEVIWRFNDEFALLESCSCEGVAVNG